MRINDAHKTETPLIGFRLVIPGNLQK